MARQRASFSSDNKNISRSRQSINETINDANVNNMHIKNSARTKARAENRALKNSSKKDLKSLRKSQGFL